MYSVGKPLHFGLSLSSSFFTWQRCRLFKSFCSFTCPSWILWYFLGWLQILILANFFFFFFWYHYRENRCEADDQLTQMPLLWWAPGSWDFQIFFFLDMDHLKKFHWICYSIISVLLCFGFKACGSLSSLTRVWTCTSCIGRWSFNHCTVREVLIFSFKPKKAQGKPRLVGHRRSQEPGARQRGNAVFQTQPRVFI